MTAQAWALLGILATVAGSYLAARVAGRSTVKAAKVSADEGAFIRAKEIFEAGIADLEDRVKRLADDLQSARAEIKTLRRSVSQYEGRVIQLQEVLRLHDIEVPPWNGVSLDGSLLPTGGLVDPHQPPPTQP